MNRLKGMRLGVAGSGIIGLCVALEAALAGAAVEVWDPQPLGQNASGVAAGMIAPLGECLFDPSTETRWRLFSAARDLWSPLAAKVSGLGLSRPGVEYRFSAADDVERALFRLADWGASVEVSKEARTSLISAEDWRVNPLTGMGALQQAVIRAGGVFHQANLHAQFFGGYDQVIVCAGIGSRYFAALAPELGRLRPIKGHIIQFPDAILEGPVVRTEDLYLVPQPKGLLVGATMERDVEDLVVDAEIVQMLRRRAVEQRPDLAGLTARGATGVRAATPDGLPMVGPVTGSTVLAAAGLLRNGWLLAPLVAQILLSYLSGAERGPYDAVLDPRRFLVSGLN